MNGLVVLIPIALFLGAAGLAAFLWTMRSGQYDDLDGAAGRILQEERGPVRVSVQGDAPIEQGD